MGENIQNCKRHIFVKRSGHSVMQKLHPNSVFFKVWTVPISPVNFHMLQCLTERRNLFSFRSVTASVVVTGKQRLRWDSQPRKPRFFGPFHFPVKGEQSELKNHWLAKMWFMDAVFHGYFYRFVRFSLWIPCIKLRKLLWFIIYNLNSWLKVSTNYYNVD